MVEEPSRRPLGCIEQVIKPWLGDGIHLLEQSILYTYFLED